MPAPGCCRACCNPSPSATSCRIAYGRGATPAEYAHLIEANLRQVVGVQTITPTLAQRTI